MVVDEIMTPNPEFLEVSSTIREAVEKLIEMDVRHLPVVEDGQLVGIISDRDLRSSALPFSTEVLDPEKTRRQMERKVSEIMRGDVISVDPDTDVAEVIDLMVESRAGAIPVVDAHSGRLKGIVSYIDVLRAARSFFN